MFDMQLPWWEFILRGGIIYCVLLIMVRFSGRRTVGQFTPFDLLVVMLLSESVSNALSGGDESITGGLIIAATLIAFNVGIAFLTSQSQKIEKIVEGETVLLGRDGFIFDHARKKMKVGKGDIERALREADCAQEEMHYMFLESDGSISVVTKKKDQGPAG